MKNLGKRVLSILCAVIMVASLSACSMSFEDSSVPTADYNAEYIEEHLKMDSASCKVIADKLDELDFGKIRSYKSKNVNGNGSFTISDKDKNKYVINFEDGVFVDLSDDDGKVIMTYEDLVAAVNGEKSGDDQESSDNGKQGKFARSLNKDNGEDNKEDNKEESKEDNKEDNREESENEEEIGGEVESYTGNGDSTASYLTEKGKEALANLDTDYNKINWDVQYTFGEDYEGLIISVTQFNDGYCDYLLVGITNLYDIDITFTADAYPRGVNGELLNESSIFVRSLPTGSTFVRKMYCNDTPTEEIHWENIEIEEETFTRALPWEASTTLGLNEYGELTVNYVLESNEVMKRSGDITAVLVDKSGNVLDANYEYSTEDGIKLEGSIAMRRHDFDSSIPVEIALFANPYTY